MTTRLLRFALLACVLAAAPAAAQSITVVVGADSVQVDLGALPAVVRVHDGEARTLAGPRLADVLAAAGVPLAGLRGAALARVAVVEASDGYRVAFALGDLAPDLGASPALLAVTADGVPLGPDEGPVRLVVPGDRRPARWARGVVRVITAE